MIREAIKKEMIDRGENVNKLSKAVNVPHPRLYGWFNPEINFNLTTDQIDKILEHYELSIVKIHG